MHKPHTPDSVPSDSRSPAELAEDWADLELLDFYRENEILDLPEGTLFSLDDMRAFIRAAFAYGITKGSESPEEYRRWLKRYFDERSKLLPPEDSQVD